MKLFAIGDLHLSHAVDKPMDVFGQHWEKHEVMIKENWLQKITEEDMVLLPGDISWATRFEDALVDLAWIEELPGKKIILRGNHDYWWQTLRKMEGHVDTIRFLQNNFFAFGDLAICGARGWLCPNDTEFTSHDEKIYKREQIRLELSLEAAKKAGFTEYMVMMHYPPRNDKLEPSGFTDLFEKYGVKTVIYGHLHSFGARDYQLKGELDGVHYYLTSSDYINFDPVRIL